MGSLILECSGQLRQEMGVAQVQGTESAKAQSHEKMEPVQDGALRVMCVRRE